MVCLTMSLPLFSQTATDTDSLIGIPTSYARQIAGELTLYDFCKQERDSLKVEINDLNSTISLNQILLEEYKLTTDSLFKANKEILNQTSALQVEVINKEEKITKLRNTRNFTFLTTILTAVLPVILKSE
jgi:hypothetical protein